MDNAIFHKRVDMVKALQADGRTFLYLPPYSPDLNLIEKKYAEVKATRRREQCSVEDVFK